MQKKKDEIKQAVKEALQEEKAKEKPTKTSRLGDLIKGAGLITQAVTGDYQKKKKIQKCYNCHNPLEEKEDTNTIKRFLCPKCGRDVHFMKATGAVVVVEPGDVKLHIEM